MLNPKPPLPVDAILPEIIHSLKVSKSLVIVAAPGAGKTTRVPPALLGILKGEVIVLEPRRIAARVAARRVAWELGEQVGETVGYQIRFEEAVGPRTRLRFITEGVLTRRLLHDPGLKGVTGVVLDEFHERHLESDLALVLLKRLQATRPNLRIVVMSATLDAEPITQFLEGCPIVHSQGRLFDLSIKHLPYSPDPLEAQVRNAVESLIGTGHVGDALIFLPGAAEIRRAMRECASVAQKARLLLLPLHGSLSAKEQDRALSPASQQKMIFATNVAESSITVEGVTAVIDSGLARVASYSHWSGLPTLQVGRVSKASATQRAGRAARNAPGLVLRLYTQEDYLRRPDYDSPEILRSDLSQLCLTLRVMGIGVNDVEWLNAPTEAAVQQAESLLDRLGAGGKMAKQLASYPLPPRLSRILVEGLERGVGADASVAVARLSSGTHIQKTDLLAAMDFEPDPQLLNHIAQLRRIARISGSRLHNDDALLISVLTGFPDRVARLRAGKQVLLSAGGSAELAGEPPTYEFMVVLDTEYRKENPLPLIRLASRIESAWLIDLFPERVKELSSVVWNRSAERVDAVSALLYDELVIEESRGAVPDANAAADLLAQKAMEAGIERFVDLSTLDEFIGRVEFAGLEVPDLGQILRELCCGLRSFAELKKTTADFISVLEHKVGARRLRESAPSSILLKKGRQTKVHYERGKQPWISSRLQDFFGMHDTPRIGPGKTPVVVHLLAPNQRPVQTTRDLAGFWERLYPTVRRELMRRYPKHAWPERPQD